MHERIAVVSTSARLLAEAAAADGWRVDAFDVFGDLDTVRSARDWRGVGRSTPGLRFDGATVLAALRQARADGVTGWVAGAGFEQQPALFAEAARHLRLFGTAPADARRLRQPRHFFAALSRHGLVHPPVGHPGDDPPRPPADGWLRKHFRGSGGWRVTPLRRTPVGPGYYAQARLAGTPMSALFVANGHEARLLGWSRQLTGAIGRRPFVYHGCLSSEPPPPPVASALARGLDGLVAEFGLRGLGSLDFIATSGGAGYAVLEINPRPSASMAVHGPGLFAAHLLACRDGSLPDPAVLARRASRGPVRGQAIVYAPRALEVSAAAAQALAARLDIHDLPRPGTRCPAAAPLCSVSAEGVDAITVHRALDSARDGILQTIFQTSDP